MKILLPLLALTLVPGARAALAFEDPFAYATGALGTTGASGGWSGSSSGVTVATGSLDGTALGLGASSSNKVTTTTSSSSGTYNQFSAGIRSNSVYYSFLLRVNNTSGLDATGKIITGLIRNGSASSYYNDIWLRLSGSDVQIGLSKLRNGTTWRSQPLTVGNVYLVVTKYEFGSSSGDDVVALWINPAAGATNEPAADVAFSTGGDGNSSTGIGRCYLYGGMSVDLDEVRIGTNWAEVTPAGGSTPVTPVTTPVITNAILAADSFIVSGTNGPANADYDVLTTTDLRQPLAQWTVTGTESFDAGGRFSFADSAAAGLGGRFYAVRVTNTNPPPVAPAITEQPQDNTNLLGNTATFTVTASGTPPLSHRWYFNTNTPVGASAQLVLNNIQFTNAGGYAVVVTNVAGSVTSRVAQLVVTNTETPPFILTPPPSQTVSLGQTVHFSVVAGGTMPLAYQWYFNGATLLTHETSAFLTLTNVSLADAGDYSVSVTNAFGSTNSAAATLTVDTNPAPDFSPIVFCNDGRRITGGEGGPVVYVGSETELQSYSDENPAYIIYVTNSFTLTGMATHIRPNKTVIGVGNVALSGGGLYLYRSTNVIIRNLTIRNSTEDNIGVHYSDHVWIDHCTFIDATDGQLDITQASDYLTVSWCKFYYTDNPPAGDHRFVSLIASSDADNGSQYHVTYHHNWWGTNCIERMPSVRFGRVHVFNDYYSAPGNNYCVRTRKEAECRVENNWFENVKNPWEQYITSFGDTQGKLYAADNNVPFLGTAYGVFWSGTTTNKDGTVRVMIPGTDTVFTPAYSYTLDSASAVPNLAIQHAGAGKGPFAP